MVYLKGPTSFFFFFLVCGYPGGSGGKESPEMQESWAWSLGHSPWRREWLPTSVFLPGESHGQRSLMGYVLWSHKVLDMTEQLTLSLSIQKLNAG